MHIFHSIESQHNFTMSLPIGRIVTCTPSAAIMSYPAAAYFEPRTLRDVFPLHFISDFHPFHTHAPPQLFSVWLKAMSRFITFHVFTHVNLQWVALFQITTDHIFKFLSESFLLKLFLILHCSHILFHDVLQDVLPMGVERAPFKNRRWSQILLHIQSWKGLFWWMWFCPPLYEVWIREMLGAKLLPWIELWSSLPTSSYFSCRIIIIFQGCANILAEQEDWWVTAPCWQTRPSYPRPCKNSQTHGANIETPWLWPKLAGGDIIVRYRLMISVSDIDWLMQRGCRLAFDWAIRALRSHSIWAPIGRNFVVALKPSYVATPRWYADWRMT